MRANQDTYLEAILDGVLICLALALAFSIRSLLRLPLLQPDIGLDFLAHFWIVPLAVPLFWTFAASSGLYGSWMRSSWMDLLLRVTRPFLYLSLLMGTAIFLFQAKTFSRGVFFLFLALAFLFIAGSRMLLKALGPWTRGSERQHSRLLIVGTRSDAAEVCRHLEQHPEYGYEVTGFVADRSSASEPAVDTSRIVSSVNDLRSLLEQQVTDEVIFAIPPSELPAYEKDIAACEEVGVTVHIKLDLVRTLFARTYSSDLDGIPLLTISATPRDPVSLAVKRFLDLVVSLMGLVLAAPLMGLCAAAIKVTSRGPVLFRQERVGLNGRRFTLYKFRTMYDGAEHARAELEAANEMRGPVFKMRQDPRVTPVGRWLRRFSVDELPQLWNVLKGDMSLVGPRPPLPEEVARYERWQRRRLSIKPGLTCLWQISGRNSIEDFEEWVRLDLAYIDNWSLGLDLRILARTVPALLLARGAH